MRDLNKNIIAACILALGLIISTTIYAYSNRYEIIVSERIIKVDKWTGTYEFIKK